MSLSAPSPLSTIGLFTALAQILDTVCDTPVFPVWLCCTLREMISSSSLCTEAVFLYASPWLPALFPQHGTVLWAQTLPAFLIHSDFLGFIFQRQGEM